MLVFGNLEGVSDEEPIPWVPAIELLAQVSNQAAKLTQGQVNKRTIGFLDLGSQISRLANGAVGLLCDCTGRHDTVETSAMLRILRKMKVTAIAKNMKVETKENLVRGHLKAFFYPSAIARESDRDSHHGQVGWRLDIPKIQKWQPVRPHNLEGLRLTRTLINWLPFPRKAG